MQKASLVAEGVYKSFSQGKGSIDVLNGISVTFVQGERYAIVGVSGIGKSTLIHILVGLDKPTAGTVSYNDMVLTRVGATKKNHFLNKSVGLVFQFPYLIRELSVLENVMMPAIIAGKPMKKCKERALFLLKKVGLEEKACERPATLSGGQQQRVSLVRALCNKPTFLLADEPTGNLDKETGKVITDLILDCQREWNMGLIISTHDEHVVEAMDHVYKLENGLLKGK